MHFRSCPRTFGSIVALSCLVAPAAWAQAPPVLTLDEATTMATGNSRLVQIAGIDLEKANSDLAALRTRRRPVFDLRGFSGSLLAPANLIFKAGTFGTFENTGPIPFVDTLVPNKPAPVVALSASIAQPLTQLKSIGLGERALEVGTDIAREQIRAQQQAVVTSVKRVYYAMVQAQSGLAANVEALALTRELERLAGEYVERRVALQGELFAAQTVVARQEQVDMVLRNTISTMKEQLNLLLGRDLGVDFTIVPVPPMTTTDIDLAAAEKLALDARPEVRNARLKAQQADFDLQRKKAEAIPAISLSVNYVGLYNFEVLPANIAMAGVIGTWEPWDWGRRREEAAVKTRTLEQAKIAVREAEESVRVDVRTQYRRVREASAMLRVAQLAQRTSRERLRVALDQYKQEAALQRQALEAQAASAESDHQYQQALAGYWTARAEFDRALGSQP